MSKFKKTISIDCFLFFLYMTWVDCPLLAAVMSNFWEQMYRKQEGRNRLPLQAPNKEVNILKIVEVKWCTGVTLTFFHNRHALCGAVSAQCVLTAFSPLLLLVEMSGHDMVCFDKTFEAAEALLHMESPGGLHSERSTGRHAVNTLMLLHSLIVTAVCQSRRQWTASSVLDSQCWWQEDTDTQTQKKVVLRKCTALNQVGMAPDPAGTPWPHSWLLLTS